MYYIPLVNAFFKISVLVIAMVATRAPGARRYCFVPNCQSVSRSNKEKISLFQVPMDKLKEWSAVIPRADRQLDIKDVLCEKHFLKEDVIREVVTETYSYPLKVPRLSENAKPSIGLYCPSYLSQKLVKKRKRSASITNNVEEDIKTEDNQSWLLKLYSKLRKNIITLPSESWTIKFENDIIAIFETVANADDIESLTETSHNQINDVGDFEEKLINFDNLSMCCGFKVDNGLTFDLSKSKYRQDELFQSIRHKQCKYVLDTETEDHLRKNTHYCLMCQNAKYAIRHLRRKATKTTISRSSLVKKNSISQCERRMKHSLNQLQMNLQEANETMKKVNINKNKKS